MGLLDSAIKNGLRRGVSGAIEKGVSEALGNAVKKVVEPKANEYANKVADSIEQTAQSTINAAQQTNEALQQASGSAQQTSGTSGDLGGAFASLQQSMERYATNAAKNMKLCPKCQTPASAENTFCPNCGAKLPEETLAQGSVCTQCGRQNTIGTKFCAGCGAKLPSAVAEENAAAENNAAVLARWQEVMPQYPTWNGGGTYMEIEKIDDYYRFDVRCEDDYAAQSAVDKYRELLQQNGFRKAGQYPDIMHLYKKVDGRCYHVDTEHCFDGRGDSPSIYFNIAEPTGGYDYVKPEAKKSFGLKDIFKL